MEVTTSPTAPQQLQAGARFGAFTIERVLGGDGPLFTAQARHVARNEPVLLRALDQSSTTSLDVLRGFESERNATLRIKHPHVPRCQEHGRTGPVLWYSREWIDGPSMQSFHRVLPADGIRPLGELALVGSCVAGALSAAHHIDQHASPIVHGDLGLGRIRLDRSGLPRLEGFCLYDPRTEKVPRSVNHDVYRLGEVLFALFVGLSPRQARAQPSWRPADLVPGFPEVLDDLLVRLLADDLNERLTDASEVADILFAFRESGDYAADRMSLAKLAQDLFPDWTFQPGLALSAPTLSGHVRPTTAAMDFQSEPMPGWSGPIQVVNAPVTPMRQPTDDVAIQRRTSRRTRKSILGRPSWAGFAIMLGVGAALGAAVDQVLTEAPPDPALVEMVADHAADLAARGRTDEARRVLLRLHTVAPDQAKASTRIRTVMEGLDAP